MFAKQDIIGEKIRNVQDYAPRTLICMLLGQTGVILIHVFAMPTFIGEVQIWNVWEIARRLLIRMQPKQTQDFYGTANVIRDFIGEWLTTSVQGTALRKWMCMQQGLTLRRSTNVCALLATNGMPLLQSVSRVSWPLDLHIFMSL